MCFRLLIRLVSALLPSCFHLHSNTSSYALIVLNYPSDRLYYVPLRSLPKETSTAHFFNIDSDLVYWNFFLDFGPLNLGQLYRFCSLLNGKLQGERLKKKVIYYYSSTHSHRRANAAFLISAWSMIYLNKSGEKKQKANKTKTTTKPV